MFFFFIIFTVLVLTYTVSTIVKPKNYPPGPRWYPFFGCNAIISSRMEKYGSQWKVISEMAKEYSTEILGLKLGSELVVAVYGEKNIRYVATEKEFDARPDSFFLRLRTFGKRIGITFVDGPLWREHKPFALKHMRIGGFGKQSSDIDIQKQLNIMLNHLENSNGNPISIRTKMAVSTVNVIWVYLAGECIKEEKLKQFLSFTSARLKAFTMAGGYLNQWPWLRFVFPKWTGYTIIKMMNEKIKDIAQETIERHKTNKVPGTDVIYAFLEEMYKSKESYTDDQLIGICIDFLIAASNTTSNYLDFAIIQLLWHPEMQEKVHEEITRVLGDKTPTWADNTKLVYTSAFLNEVHRCCTIAPFAGGRRTLSNVVIDGYVIPKGATVLMSLGDLHRDPDFWDRSDMFMPERFIDGNGELKNITHMYPFSLGRRRCPGEPFAKSFNFIMFVGIVQKYKILCNGRPPSAEPVIGILAEPLPFTANFVKRQF